MHPTWGKDVLQAFIVLYNTYYAGNVRVNVSLPEVVCETFGIGQPNIVWSIDKHKVPVTANFTVDGLSFKTVISDSEDLVLDMWYSAATRKLTLNESFASFLSSTKETVVLRCLHKLASGECISSEPFQRKQSVVLCNVSIFIVPKSVIISSKFLWRD